jgi:hypothetical protein
MCCIVTESEFDESDEEDSSMISGVTKCGGWGNGKESGDLLVTTPTITASTNTTSSTA